MVKIKTLQTKYQQVSSDTLVPYKYIPETILELSKDLTEIERIISDNKDSEVLKACEILKTKLNASLAYFKPKMTNIPNINYLDESDEDWVDENMPP